MNEAGRRIRVLLVDDHEMVREGLMAMLQPEPDIEVVGHAQSVATEQTVKQAIRARRGEQRTPGT